jgi:PKD repeat protein
VGEGEQIQFTGSYIDPDLPGAFGTDILWDFGDGSTITGTLTPIHIYGDNGVYTVLLNVTDEEGGIGSDELTVTVENRDPTMEDLPAQSAAIGGFVTFSAAYFDPGFLDSHTASIDWDDGTIEAGTVDANTVSGSHTFTEEGVFLVPVTLTDDDGGVTMQTFTVTVSGYQVYLPIVSR